MRPLIEQKLPSGFLVDLVKATSAEGWETFKVVFSPLMESLVDEARKSSIVDSTYKPALLAVTELCELRSGNTRPFCQLLTEMVSQKFFRS